MAHQFSSVLRLCSVAALVFFFTGCPPSEQEMIRTIEQQRVEKLSDLRSGISSSFLFGTIVYVLITLVGPSVAEGARSTIAKQFNWSKNEQIVIAKVAYWGAIGSVAVFSFFNQHLASMKPAVWLLLGATAYPFFIHVLPSIEDDDKPRRKAAMGQIKSLLMLIFIFYVVLRFLSPDGFGEIKLQ
jgi:hypothetical protein